MSSLIKLNALITTFSWGWRDASEVKSTYGSCRAYFGCQHSPQEAHNHVTLDPGNPTPSSASVGTCPPTGCVHKGSHTHKSFLRERKQGFLPLTSSALVPSGYFPGFPSDGVKHKKRSTVPAALSVLPGLRPLQ